MESTRSWASISDLTTGADVPLFIVEPRAGECWTVTRYGERDPLAAFSSQVKAESFARRVAASCNGTVCMVGEVSLVASSRKHAYL